MLVRVARLAIIKVLVAQRVHVEEKVIQIIIRGIMSLSSSKKRRTNLNEHMAVSFFWIKLTWNVEILHMF